MLPSVAKLTVPPLTVNDVFASFPPRTNVPGPLFVRAKEPEMPPLTFNVWLAATFQAWPVPKTTGAVIVRLLVAPDMSIGLLPSRVRVLAPPIETVPEGVVTIRLVMAKF